MRWDVGIDLGSANVRMATIENGLILDEPAMVAMRDEEHAAYIGEGAWRLLGREPRGLHVAAPLKDGVPESTLYTTAMFQWLFRKSGDRKRRFSALISCSPAARPAYREALMQSALDAGASDVALVRSDAISALGSGVDLMGPQTTFVVDVGAGKMTATLLAMGREIAFGSVPYGTNRINERIIASLRAEYGFAIGWRTAEDVKLALSSAHPGDLSKVKTRAAGLDIYERAPRLAEISPELIAKLCVDPLKELMGVCRSVISEAPEEVSADLNDIGAVLTGGGAQIPGLDKLIGDNLGIPCSIADSPALCGIKGINSMLLEPDRYEALIVQRMAIAQKR